MYFFERFVKVFNLPFILFLFVLVTVFATGSVSSASTLEIVKKNDKLRCGVSAEVPGFSSLDSEGEWSGLDVDICKAVAAAVLADTSKVEFFPQVEAQGLTALQTGEIDILVSTSGWSLSRDTALGLTFVGASYFGDQGFMIRKEMGETSSDKLSEPTICMQDEIVLRHNLARYLQGDKPAEKPAYKTIVFKTQGQAVKAFDAGRCDLLFDMKASLQGLRKYLVSAEDVLILPEIVAREVHGPVVRQGDHNWFSIIRWTIFTMLKAEEYNIDSTNVDEYVLDEKQDLEHLLGGRGGSGIGLGLDRAWMYQIIKQVGNYQEVFDRNFGKKSSIKMERGLNQLWMDGGLHYSPAFQ